LETERYLKITLSFNLVELAPEKETPIKVPSTSSRTFNAPLSPVYVI
jgi:hypothetical protein